jgi:hypothetical protein
MVLSDHDRWQHAPVAMRALIGLAREPDGPPLLNVFAAFDDAS